MLETSDSRQSIEAVLQKFSQAVEKLLSARCAGAAEVYAPPKFSAEAVLKSQENSLEILIFTADAPGYRIKFDNLKNALTKAERETLEHLAWAAARRVDFLRVSHERCEREIREQEFIKLAAEAELRALRSQINPHFLFNALTTVGYLIQSAPEKALETLLQLTQLLRGVLRVGGEFWSLREEIKLIEAYLEIERARFEERLTVEIRIAPEVEQMRVPSLILQPLVENAVKHGITPKKGGGIIKITAKLEKQKLVLKVCDTGAGVSEREMRRKRESRVGLNNVEQRLHLYFNGFAGLSVKSRAGAGTIAAIEIELDRLRTDAATVAQEIRKTKFELSL